MSIDSDAPLWILFSDSVLPTTVWYSVLLDYRVRAPFVYPALFVLCVMPPRSFFTVIYSTVLHLWFCRIVCSGVGYYLPILPLFPPFFAGRAVTAARRYRATFDIPYSPPFFCVLL